MKQKNTVKQAFIKTLPVMAGYVVLGTGFGILLRNAGYGVLWAFAMSLLIYAGSMQYVGVSLLAGGASIITTAMTTFIVNARHLFYSISMVDRYKDAGKFKPYMIFGLTDETYSLLCDGLVPEGSDPTLSGDCLQSELLGDRECAGESAGYSAAFFYSRDRIFYDGAVHCFLHRAVADFR